MASIQNAIEYEGALTGRHLENQSFYSMDKQISSLTILANTS